MKLRTRPTFRHQPINRVGLRIANHKCFGAEPQGVRMFARVNIVIGPNNAGKSAFLDAIQMACESDLANIPHDARIVLRGVLSSQGDFFKHIKDDLIDGPTPDFLEAAYKDKPITFELTRDDCRVTEMDEIGEVGKPGHWSNLSFRKKAGRLAHEATFEHHSCHRLRSDRDIVPEESRDQTEIAENGAGITDTIRRYLTWHKADYQLVEQRLLSALNEVLRPEIVFTQIRVFDQGEKWEIYLDVEGVDKAVPLSSMGSGVRTVLASLAFFMLRPLISEPTKRPIFIFEELENNLHPTLQRRLATYLLENVKETMVFSTHSPTLLESLSASEDAQLIRVRRTSSGSELQVIEEYGQKRELLQDLGVRASDVLQTNCVIWLEGPSDRIYFKRWLELWAPDLVEGVHFQFVFYGGGPMATYLSGGEEATIDLLLVNQNCIFLVDSDITMKKPELSETRQRVIDLVNEHGYAWHTAGKEVEHYVPEPTLKTVLETDRGLGEQEPFSGLTKYAGKGSKPNKVKWAKAFVNHESYTKEALTETRDLAEHVEKVASLIRKWNGIDTAQPEVAEQ